MKTFLTIDIFDLLAASVVVAFLAIWTVKHWKDF
jgi:hypothetical protein